MQKTPTGIPVGVAGLVVGPVFVDTGADQHFVDFAIIINSKAIHDQIN